LEARLGGNKFKANTVIAIKLGRAAYFKKVSVLTLDRLGQISTLSAWRGSIAFSMRVPFIMS
jgi:hypothetical protein